MIISRTPFRISFFGGYTDYPVWYEKNGGAVLSTTIDKYCYITARHLPPFFPYRYRIRYTQREEVSSIDEIQHPSVRACLRFLNVEKGIEMVHTSDLPARTGIGSSSAFTVGFLHALHALGGRMVSKRQLTQEALHVEQNIIQETVGSQDQTAAAFGGLNRIEFGPGKGVRVLPMTIPAEQTNALQNHLMLFFSGFSRTASTVARRVTGENHKNEHELRTMRAMVDRACEILNSPTSRLEEFGELLDESWRFKRSLSPEVSNPRIDAMYQAARRAGALGGKLLGAGGGGFILLFVKPENQPRVRTELAELLHVPFHLENLGSQIIYYSHSDNIDRT